MGSVKFTSTWSKHTMDDHASLTYQVSQEHHKAIAAAFGGIVSLAVRPSARPYRFADCSNDRCHCGSERWLIQRFTLFVSAFSSFGVPCGRSNFAEEDNATVQSVNVFQRIKRTDIGNIKRNPPRPL